MAVVIKYADNILKGFATSISIIVSCIASVYLFETQINSIFILGTSFVVVSTVLYSYSPQKSIQSSFSESSKIETVVLLPADQK